MPPNHNRKNYPWFDDHYKKNDEEFDEDYYKEDFEEIDKKKPKSIREMEIQKAIRMIHRIREVYDPLVDIIECPKIIIVAVELQGVKGYNITLKMVEQTLTIGFKRNKIQNIRILKLPKPVDPKPIKSLYKNGVLFLELKKRERPAGKSLLPISNIRY
jgi:HSP20 family molecular chaperone IbpA